MDSRELDEFIQEVRTLEAERRGSSRQAAQYASTWAEIYLGSVASLTAAGDLIVTVSDIAEEGFSWQHLIIALPFVPHLPGAIRSVRLKFKGGRTVEIDGVLLQELKQLDAAEYELVTTAVSTAQNPEEALARIKHALVNRKNSPFQVHVDPHTGRGPMAIDTSNFKGGVSTKAGGIRFLAANFERFLLLAATLQEISDAHRDDLTADAALAEFRAYRDRFDDARALEPTWEVIADVVLGR